MQSYNYEQNEKDDENVCLILHDMNGIVQGKSKCFCYHNHKNIDNWNGTAFTYVPISQSRTRMLQFFIVFKFTHVWVDTEWSNYISCK